MLLHVHDYLLDLLEVHIKVLGMHLNETAHVLYSRYQTCYDKGTMLQNLFTNSCYVLLGLHYFHVFFQFYSVMSQPEVLSLYTPS